MKFFVPHAKRAECETVYTDIARSLKDQFRMRIDERRIFALDYVNSKRRWRAEVGQLEQQEDRYEIIAIYESKSYIIFTRTQSGEAGLTIMVDKSEVTAVEEFE
jgi:hypothetical protein